MEESKKESKNGWGGRREGAGRRPGENPSTRSIALRIPEDVAEILDRQKNRSAYIIEAIRAYDREQRKHMVLGLEIGVTKEK